ncbi:formyltransferase family protein [Mucilaginibacter sp. dw_454]|uniref:methionyl-tRNA formyltransferase n=1 Tax=Mucilaginibacter sp. dw_454 TaxID=2720079 RepID=UPI001BD303F4|nr:formyltransferase family protein [Mucilaginibacter sp. dw_454]
MKIIVVANHAGVLPALNWFNSQGWLQAVISSDRLAGHNLQIQDYCQSQNITHLKLTQQQLHTQALQLFNELEPDMALMYGFAYRIPPAIFTIPRLGFYNVHFSLLPAYSGSDPVFWQLKNGERQGGITIHKVDEGFDSGVVVLQQAIPFLPGESWGICNSRYGSMTIAMITQLCTTLAQGDELPLINTDNRTPSYYPKPTAVDLAIFWDRDNAGQIESLVNACNPSAGGAITTYMQQEVRILEVSPVDGQGEAGVKGGTIIHADASGLFVQCADRSLLRINILKLNEGYLTGFKLAALGIKAGHCFENVVFENLTSGQKQEYTIKTAN